jgi:hypothetical protein
LLKQEAWTASPNNVRLALVRVLLALLGVALVVFGSLVLLKWPDRPGGKIEFKGLIVDSKGAGLPIIALGVIAVATSAIAVAGSGGVAGELPEHAVAPAALVDAVLTAVGV